MTVCPRCTELYRYGDFGRKCWGIGRIRRYGAAMTIILFIMMRRTLYVIGGYVIGGMAAWELRRMIRLKIILQRSGHVSVDFGECR